MGIADDRLINYQSNRRKQKNSSFTARFQVQMYCISIK